MVNTVIGFLVALLFLNTINHQAFATESPGISASQEDYERQNQTVVRNKIFYKEGRLEVELLAGVMPYDSLVNHYLAGGRLDWHISDHWGWEVIDAMYALPSVTGYTMNTVSTHGISNLQTTQTHLILTSNLLASPFYGKIRLMGREVLYYDIYMVGGVGAENNDTIQASTTAVNGNVSINVLRTGFDPTFDLGIGFKMFLNSAMGMVVDLRDYVSDSQIYGKNVLKSEFAVFVGFTFFIPTFG
jgi:outer membrane beta-barrel protein